MLRPEGRTPVEVCGFMWAAAVDHRHTCRHPDGHPGRHVCACRSWQEGRTPVEVTAAAERTAEEPIEVGWYAYSGGAQKMVFHLRAPGRWSVHFDNGTASDCVWGYIEQALGVWDLVLLDHNATRERDEALAAVERVRAVCDAAMRFTPLSAANVRVTVADLRAALGERP